MVNKTIYFQRHLRSTQPQIIHLGNVQNKFYIDIAIENSTCDTEGYRFTLYRQQSLFDSPYIKFTNELIFKKQLHFMDMLGENEIYDLSLDFKQLYNYNKEMQLSRIKIGKLEPATHTGKLSKEELLLFLDKKTQYYVEYKQFILQKSQLRLRKYYHEDCTFDVSIQLNYETFDCFGENKELKPPFLLQNTANPELQYMNRLLLASVRQDNELVKLIVCWFILLVISIVAGMFSAQEPDKDNTMLTADELHGGTSTGGVNV